MLNTKVFALTPLGEWKKGTISVISSPCDTEPRNYNQAHENTEFTVDFDDKRIRKRKVLKAGIFPLNALKESSSTTHALNESSSITHALNKRSFTTRSPVVDLTDDFSLTKEEQAFRATTPSKPDYGSKLHALTTQMARKERRFEDELRILRQQVNGPIQDQLNNLEQTFNWNLYDSFRVDQEVDMSPNLQAEEPTNAKRPPSAELVAQSATEVPTFDKLAEKGERKNTRQSKRQKQYHL